MTTQDKIKHLYWRAGFGQTIKEWKASENQTLSQSIDHLFAEAKSAKKLSGEELYHLNLAEKKNLLPNQRKQLRQKSKELIAQQNANWIGRMTDSKESSLLEKMSLFWHGHFACISKVPKTAFQQLVTIRQHALGNFRELVLAIAKDPSMIRFLNNQQNKKNSPNENFARELMELFTIGRGHYTEEDVKEAARAFTGWSSNLKGEFVFKERQHDFGQKKFMGQKGTFNGDDIINIILDQKQTAIFITTKVYRFFVNEKINTTHIQQLADVFYHSKYDIEKLMRTIFQSDWFYASENVGNKIKSPIEFIAGMMRQLNVKFKDPSKVIFIQKALGQILFNPPNVAGWPGGKSWIDNSTLMLRLNLINFLILASDMSFKVKEEFEANNKNKIVKRIEANVDIQPLVNSFKNRSFEEIFNGLHNYLLQATPRQQQDFFNGFVIKRNKEDYIKSMMIRLLSLPEYQMS